MARRIPVMGGTWFAGRAFVEDLAALGGWDVTAVSAPFPSLDRSALRPHGPGRPGHAPHRSGGRRAGSNST